jgi:HAD superfamily hydrolase (TIGR01549 family)
VLVRAILLDLDETLYDERGCVTQSLTEASAYAAERFPGLQRAHLEAIYLEEANKRWDAFELEIQMKGRSAQLDSQRVREMCFAQALAISGGAPSFAAELTRFYSEHRSARHLLFSDAKRTVEKLRKQAFVALVSNGGSGYQREKLRATGIEPLFHAVVISEEAGYSKPQRGIFERALRELSVLPHEAVMVGDNLEKDILGAKNLGLRGVLICRNGSKPRFAAGQPRPDAILGNLQDLPKTLTTFAGKRK